MPKRPSKKKDSTINLGFEAKLWAAADALRNNMDAAEYKHVVLGLVFLKYISDAFEAKHAELVAQKKQGADPEDQCAAAHHRHSGGRRDGGHRARQPVAQGRAAEGLRPARSRQAAARAD